MPADFNVLNVFGGGGIATVQSFGDRPSNPEDGDLFMIESTKQLYRASGGNWVEGWHPEVSTVGNAAPGNVEGELVLTSDEGPYRWDSANTEWDHAGIAIGNTFGDRPSSPSDGDLFMISGTKQIYRASGGIWNQGWYPEVNDIADADPGNVDGELIRTQTEGPYRWDAGRSEWVHAGIELVSTWGDRPSSPNDDDLIRITSTDQIYRASGGSFVEGFHPAVTSIGDASDGNIEGEVVYTDDKGPYFWRPSVSEWEQPSPPVEKMDAGTVDFLKVSYLFDDPLPELQDPATKPSQEPAQSSLQTFLMVEFPDIRQSTVNNVEFESRPGGFSHSARLVPYPNLRDAAERSNNKIDVDGGYTVV